MNAKMSDFKSLRHLYLLLFRNTVNETNIKNRKFLFRNYKKGAPLLPKLKYT